MSAPKMASRRGHVRKSLVEMIKNKIWSPHMLRPTVVVICMFAVTTMLFTIVHNMEWKSFKHLAFDSGYSHVEVIKSQSDDVRKPEPPCTVLMPMFLSGKMDYRFFVLPNGLQVLAVSDPSADRVAASMDVSVGHFSDPEELPGLAHFLEHMLFMGSKKYPDENQYSAFLSQHGGSSNAYTAAENTNYQFQITPEYFDEAIDVFAQFFVSPLLRKDSTVREVNAVENEHIKNLQSDGWRANQLRKGLSNPLHPNHKFGTGNLQTLCNNTHAGSVEDKCTGTLLALRKFYKEHYIAPRMRLCVVAKHAMEELEALVRRSFSDIPADGGKKEPPFWRVEVRPPKSGARVIKWVPITDQRIVSISWTLPPMINTFKHKAAAYLSHLIGHEAAGSVAALLKKKGLIESLSAGADDDQRYAGGFDVQVSLTSLGLSKVDEVIDTIFSYIRLLQTTGPQEWVWRESKALADMHFRFKEKSDPVGYAVGLASALQIYPPQYVIAAGYTYDGYEPRLIEDLLKALHPGQADIYIASRGFEGKLGGAREPIYGTEYSLLKVSQETISRWSTGKVDPGLHLVNPNPFIPTDFTLVPAPRDGVHPLSPTKLVDKPGARLWYKQDYDMPGKNWKAKPKLSLMFQISTPVASRTPRAAVLSQLYTMLYNDAMTLTTYDAGVAGLSWGLSSGDDGLSLSVGGYSDKLPLLLKQVTEHLVTCLWAHTQCIWTDQNRFETMKDELTRALENSKKSSPYQRATESTGRLMKKRSFSVDRMLYELSLPTVTLDALADHVKALFEKVHVEALVHGNAGDDVARSSLQVVLSSLGSAVLPSKDSETDVQQVAKLDNGFIFAEAHTNPDDLNHAIELYYQWPLRGIEWDIMVALFGEMVSEPCFDQLRTKEQLGYIVACRSRPMAGSYPPAVNGLSVIIQSSFKPPHELDKSARSFVDGFVRNMTLGVGEVKFQAHKAALLASIREKEKTVHEETGRIWGEIVKRRYDWGRRGRLENALAPITLANVREMAQKLTKIQSHSLAVWVYGKGEQPPDDLNMMQLASMRTRIHSISMYKNSPPDYFPSIPPPQVGGGSPTLPDGAGPAKLGAKVPFRGSIETEEERGGAGGTRSRGRDAKGGVGKDAVQEAVKSKTAGYNAKSGFKAAKAGPIEGQKMRAGSKEGAGSKEDVFAGSKEDVFAGIPKGAGSNGGAVDASKVVRGGRPAKAKAADAVVKGPD